MKSGGPWNLRGLRPETREAARDAARESGMSVGEWLNDVIPPEDENEHDRYADDDDDRGSRRRTRESRQEADDETPRRQARRHRRFDDVDADLEPTFGPDLEPRLQPRLGPRAEPRGSDRGSRRRDRSGDFERASEPERTDDWRTKDFGRRAEFERDRDDDRYPDRDRDSDRDQPRLREAARAAARARDEERQAARVKAREAGRARHEGRERGAPREDLPQAIREEAREAARAEEMRQAARARAEMGEVHARLDRLSHQLDRLTRPETPKPTAPRYEAPRYEAPRYEAPRPDAPRYEPRLTGAPPALHRDRTAPMARPQAASPAMGRTASGLSVDDAIAEIAERQATLYGETQTVALLAPRAPVAFVAQQPVPEAAPAPMSFGSRPPQPLPQSAPVEPPAPKAAAPLPEAVSPPITPSVPAAPALDISKLEEQLRNITARIETLRPSNDLEEQLRNITARIETLRPNNDFEEVIASFRKELAEIGRQITEALPRHAVESLQIEVQALAQRIDHSRGAGGVDAAALAGLERGLAEVRDALHKLTPAENLVGFDDAVRSLAQKIDLIIGKEDPAALQQLETAISALRGIVSHVASNDTLTKVAEDVRALAAKVDEFANNAASGQAVSALESRLDTLADALNASTEAGHAVPRELEKLLSGLIEKLEWVQLTHTDHAALGHLEDRIAQLIKRLDASDAKLGNLEAIERGLADLLVHINDVRSHGGAVASASPPPPAVDAIKRDVAEIKHSDRRTQDSLEAVHGTVEHVVDRLAKIESGMHDAPAQPNAASAPVQTDSAADIAKTDFAKAAPAKTEPVKSEAAKTEPAKAELLISKPAPASSAPMPAASVSPLAVAPAPAAPAAITPAPLTISAADALLGPAESSFDAAPRRMVAATPRAPIDPNLPPDHPLEPRSAPGSRGVSSGTLPSAADRIAASEAAAGLVEPPAAADLNDKSNFIAAARKAAQAAAAEPPDRKSRAKKQRAAAGGSSQRVRKLLVAGGAVVVAVLFVHVVLHMFQDNGGSTISPPPLPEHSDTAPEKESAATPPADAPPAPAVPDGATDTPRAAPGQPLSLAPDTQPDPSPAAAPSPLPVPQRQSALPDSPDVTGALTNRAPPSFAPAPGANPFQPIPVPAPAVDADKLPATIGGPTLRAAAAAGDSAAEYEVASRFAEGHGIAVSNEQAAHWLQRAADQGLAPAQFRLGGLYEKGIGVRKDLAKARDLYTAAADKGNGKAMHNLAVLYAEGVNGPADYKSAAHWFRKAADRGITDSQYNLAILYARGIGVEQNYAESYKWFTLAANRGDADAGKKRDEIASHLDPQSLQAAQDAAQKWTATAQPDDAITVKAPAGGWDPQAAKPATKPKATGAKAGAPEAKL
jgi:localization factor PodJL